jgi:endonuclease/exonuclease/phosphatase family metal-dependent hydrolase
MPRFARPLPALLLALLVVAGLAACRPPGADDDPPGGGPDAGAPADASPPDAAPVGSGGCLPTADPAEARGVLELANDATVDAAALAALGLDPAEAAAIIAARPLADLAGLDAVTTDASCDALAAEACRQRGRCEPTLTMWTWNLEHFPRATGTVADAAAILASRGVELVGFEEIDSPTAFDQLLAALPGWAGLVGVEGFSTRVALAYRTERLHPVAVEHLFADDPDRFPRPVLVVTFELDGAVGTTQFTVAVVHLKAMTDAASFDRRRRAVAALQTWMYQRRLAGTGDIIIVGDWNDDVDDPRGANIFDPFFTFEEHYALWTTPAAAAGQISYLPFGGRLIDHLVAARTIELHLPPDAVAPVRLDDEVADYRDRVSDHLPVAAVLRPILPLAP